MDADSAAALGISHRLGTGRVRHLEVEQLWIQEKTRPNEVQPIKVKTATNRGDLMTKFLDPERHWELVGALPLRVPSARRGTSALAVATVLMLLPETAEATGEVDIQSVGIIPTLLTILCVIIAWLCWRLRGKKKVRTKGQSTHTESVGSSARGRGGG